MMSTEPQMHFLYQLSDRLKKDTPEGKLCKTLDRSIKLVDRGCELLGQPDEDTQQDDKKSGDD